MSRAKKKTGYISQNPKANWSDLENDSDELIFASERVKKHNVSGSKLPELPGYSRRNGRNPKGVSFRANVKGAINNERAI